MPKEALCLLPDFWAAMRIAGNAGVSGNGVRKSEGCMSNVGIYVSDATPYNPPW